MYMNIRMNLERQILKISIPYQGGCQKLLSGLWGGGEGTPLAEKIG